MKEAHGTLFTRLDNRERSKGFNEQPFVSDSSSDLSAELARYLLKDNSYATQCAIANEIAASKKNLWELCARKMETTIGDERLALAHFASAYYKRGPRQKDELIKLLYSDDINLAYWLLELLCDARDLGPNGEWLDTPLGDSEMPPHISRIRKCHSELNLAAASTLGVYGRLAKSETGTLLLIALSHDEVEAFAAKAALTSVDRDLAIKFGLDRYNENMSDKQRTQIEDYLGIYEE